MATSLISEDCGKVSEANHLFATKKGLLVLRPGRDCCCFPYFTIPSGCYALVTSHGADVDHESTGSAVWPAGIHFLQPPWVAVSHLVTKQSVVLDLPVKACKTKDNVTVTIDVALVFRIMGDVALGEDPELVRHFVHELKPRGLEQQLRDAQEEAVRGLARGLKHTEIYGLRTGAKKDHALGERVKENILKGSDNIDVKDGEDDHDEQDDEKSEEGGYRDEILEGSSDVMDRSAAKRAFAKGCDSAAVMRAQLNKQFIPQGVEIQSVMIKSITLPEDITSQMNEKTMIISQNAQQKMYHENEMQTNRMEQEVQTLQQSFYEQRQEEITSGAERINEERVKLNDAVAQAIKSEANIREETAIKIENIKAETAFKKQEIKDRMHAEVLSIETEAQKEAAELLANTRLETETALSKAKIQASKNAAKIQMVISNAEGKIAPWLKQKNEFESQLRELEVFDELSLNKDLIINASKDDGVNLVVVADAILQHEANENNSSERSELMAELALTSQGSSGFMPMLASASSR